jgi:hypothetical protein
MADTQQPACEAAIGDQALPVYEPPTVVTYTDEELLEALGPARAGSPPGDGLVWGRPGERGA